jgi:dihydrodipicolinate synthase/N-acetylneuraminate lyase
MLLEGIFLPLTTPFHPDGKLFARKLEANVARYSLTPAAGMIVGSLEAEALTDEEAACVLETAMKSAGEAKVMIAAVGGGSLVRTLVLAQCAATAGYDALALRPPAFAADPDLQAEVLTFVRIVADRSGLPVLLDSRTMPLASVAELARHPNVLGAINDRAGELLGLTQEVTREVTVTSVFAAATGRMLRRGSGLLSAASLLGGAAVPVGGPAVKTRRKTVGFQVLGAQTSGMLAGWRAGAAGSVPLLGPCAPQACCEVWQAFRDGDQALAEEKQARILVVAAKMEGVRGIAAVKYACDVNGYYGGPPRLPLFALDGAQKLELEAMLASLKT